MLTWSDLTRLRTNPTAIRVALVTAASATVLCVIATTSNLAVTTIAALLSLTFFCRRRPVLALLIGVTAMLAVGVLGWFTDGLWLIWPYLGVLVPITFGALDERRAVRGVAAGLAGSVVLGLGVWEVAQNAMYGSGLSGLRIVSAALLCGLPFVAAWVLRRPDARAVVRQFVRDRIPTRADFPQRPRLVIGIAVALYTAAVLLDLSGGHPLTVLTAAPLAAALVWARTRPDTALTLAALGLGLVGVLVPITTGFGSGEFLLALGVAVPVFFAFLDERSVIRYAAIALGVAVAVVGGALSGSVAPAIVAVLLGGAAFGAATVWRQRHTATRLQVRLRDSERRGRVAQRSVEIEQERTRIAREVHDVVAHSLAVVIAQADGARFAAESNPVSVAPALEAIADTARAALGEVRTMLHDLRSVDGDVVAPGPDDIGAVVATVRTLGVEIDEVTFGVRGRVTEEAGLAMFRIAQEALTNALRHGDRSASITVDVDWGDQVVVLVVTNAVPVHAVPATERAGHGIPGMRERAGLVGGECTAGIGSNGRFRVRATLPVLPAAEPQGQDEVTDAISAIFASARPRVA